ncbi:MAG: hypothetical protein AAF639_15350 [Chloroflexota bacterium]
MTTTTSNQVNQATYLNEPSFNEPALTAQDRRRTVLVVVMNNEEDMRRVASEGWYRIPQRRAPRRIGADYLAFYQTGAFKGQPEAQTITYYAATRKYRLLTRAELLPDEADHARSNEFYFRIDIGPLQRLAAPIPATKMRRVTFIHTTMEKLLSAQDVREVFYEDDPFERLWKALRDHRLRPLKNRIVGEEPLDITLRARGGYLGIRCSEDMQTKERRLVTLPDRWEVLQLSPHEIEQDMNACLRRIGAALLNLGGSDLNLGTP